MAKFQTGQSGNPAGKPKNAKDKRTALRALLEPHAPELVSRCVEMAKAGDPTAMRIVMDRLVAPVREEPIRVNVPKIENASDCVAAQASLVAAVACGEVLPTAAQLMSNLIDALRKSYETEDLATRLESLEVRMQQRGRRS